jgi:DNA-binding NarL/FixJ family response regulator
MGLMSVLQFDRRITVVGTAEDGRQAIALFREHRPDVVLMDLRMPEVDGIEATRQIRAQFPDARIIMLTTYDADEDARRSLEAGASGYVLKTAGQTELMDAIQTVQSGGQWIPAGLTKRLKEYGHQPALTMRQLEVLELLAKGLSNKEIASVLGFTEDGTKEHLKAVFAKLGVNDRVEAVVTAIQRGLIRIE